MISIEEVIKQLNKFPELKNLVPDLAAYLQSPEKVESKVISRVDDIRKELIKILNLNDKTNTTKADAAYNALLTLAELKPINDEDPSSMEIIKDDEKVFVSTGYQFDINGLITWHNTRPPRDDETTTEIKRLLNPVTNQEFSLRDTDHIQRVAEKKRIKINNAVIQDTVQEVSSPSLIIWMIIIAVAHVLCAVLVFTAAFCVIDCAIAIAEMLGEFTIVSAAYIGGVLGMPVIFSLIGFTAGSRLLIAGLAIGVLLVLSGVGILPGVALLATTIGVPAGILLSLASSVGYSLLGSFMWGGRAYIINSIIPNILIGIKNSIDFVVNIGKSIFNIIKSLVTYPIHPEVGQVRGAVFSSHRGVLAQIAQGDGSQVQGSPAPQGDAVFAPVLQLDRSPPVSVPSPPVADDRGGGYDGAPPYKLRDSDGRKSKYCS